MKSRKTKYFAGALQHVYKITDDAGILFYRIEDRLMMFTIQSVVARKLKMRVVGLSYMFTHIHEGLCPIDMYHMTSFERDCMRLYVENFNKDTSRKGILFKHQFGYASKSTEKEKRTCLIYIANNHPEKKLCKYAADDRWSFVAYYNNSHPFSEPLNKHYASYYLKEAIKIVNNEYDAGRYLKSATIRSMLNKIRKPGEREQLIDYIISKYMFIDYEYSSELFGSFDNFIQAAQSMTGAEYDVGEMIDRYSDVPYKEMISLAEKDGLLGQDMKVFKMNDSELRNYATRYRRLTHATDKHILAFFFRKWKRNGDE